MGLSTLDQIVDQSRELYSLPGVAMRLLDLTSRAEVDAAAVKACVEVDPALTAKILRVVNSSLFGLSRQVSDLNQSLALLGVKPLKLLVLGFSLPDDLFVGMAGDLLRYYWRRTLTRAIVARDLTELYWKQPGEEAFVVALLRDLGILVLAQGLGKPYVDFWEKVRSSGERLGSIERETIGFDHRQLTSQLLSQWRLPEALVVASGSTGDPMELAALSAKSRGLHEALHLAEAFCELLVDNRPDVWPELLERGRARITEGQAQVLAGGCEAKVRQLAELLSVEVAGGPTFSEIITEAHQRLARVAADAAVDLVRIYREHERLEFEQILLSDEVRRLREAAESFKPRHGRMAEPARAVVPAGAVACAPAESIRESSFLKSPLRQTPVVREAPAPGSTSAACDPTLLRNLATLAWACRRDRCAMSLLLIELEKYAELVFSLGAPRAQDLLDQIENACREFVHPGSVCLRVRDATFALVLPDCDRTAAVEFGRELLHAVRTGGGQHAPALAIGCATVALPPPNFAPISLVEAADRCMHAARSSGGNWVKSIEIY